jgi:hypothetical protein
MPVAVHSLPASSPLPPLPASRPPVRVLAPLNRCLCVAWRSGAGWRSVPRRRRSCLARSGCPACCSTIRTAACWSGTQRTVREREAGGCLAACGSPSACARQSSPSAHRCPRLPAPSVPYLAGTLVVSAIGTPNTAAPLLRYCIGDAGGTIAYAGGAIWTRLTVSVYRLPKSHCGLPRSGACKDAGQGDAPRCMLHCCLLWPYLCTPLPFPPPPCRHAGFCGRARL